MAELVLPEVFSRLSSAERADLMGKAAVLPEKAARALVETIRVQLLNPEELKAEKAERVRLHINRLEKKISSGHPRSDELRVQRDRQLATLEIMGHEEELERLNQLRRGGVRVRPETAIVGGAGRAPRAGVK